MKICSSNSDRLFELEHFLNRSRNESGKMKVSPTENPTPFEFLESRWWEAAMPIFFKLAIALNNGVGVPIDEGWNPVGTRICTSIRKAIDIIIRYNEIIDVLHDAHSNEPMNEVHVAMRYGGLTAVKEYAAACVDEVATCQCSAGDASHEYAADIAIGSSAWYGHVPHTGDTPSSSRRDI